jgi:hypothetical protein
MGKIDIALRHVAQRHPEHLIRPLLAPGLSLEIGAWIETQLTTLERRLDKTLAVRVAGALRLVHLEFQAELTAAVPYRIFEYGALLLIALRACGERGLGPPPEAPQDEPAAPPGPLPPIEAVVIVLGGRREPWPSMGEYRTGWPEAEFSGVRFRIEAVYQRTVAELLAREGALWLVFASLAVDASVDRMHEVIDAIREREPDDVERAELYAALLQLAELDPWGHNLRKEIAMMVEAIDQEIIMESETLREVFEKGEEKGTEKGIEKTLRGLFARRIGRELTTAEQRALAAQARTQDGEPAVQAALDLEGEALVRWLLGSLPG